MGTMTGAVTRVVRSGRGLLPSGQLLTPEVWERCHRGIVWLLWLHVAGLAAFAVVRGYGLLHGLQEASLVAVFAVPAAHPAFARRARSAAFVVGLITASAVFVHLSGRVVEAHFHFFVMIGVITRVPGPGHAGTPPTVEPHRGTPPTPEPHPPWRGPHPGG
jgi:hypothetical protein